MRRGHEPGRLQRPPARHAAAAAAGAVILVGLAACAGFSEPVAVPVQNDLGRTVTLAVCKANDCSTSIDPGDVRPGRTTYVNVEVNGGYSGAIVHDADGRLIGCLPLRLSKRPRAGFVVPISKAVPCGTSGGAQAAHGKDWPDPNL